MKLLRFKELLIIHCVLLSCVSSSAQISQLADSILINDSVISTGHIGISIYEPATNTYLYNYNATKYFVPASNTKLFTCYAGMKYLGDSLVGLRYRETDSSTIIYPTGDPTFLHPDFKTQPVFNFLNTKSNIEYCTQYFFDVLGKGWAWDDYIESFMAQRSEFPIYGNLARVYTKNNNFFVIPKLIPLQILTRFNHNEVKGTYAIQRVWGHKEIEIAAIYNNEIKKRDSFEIPIQVDLFYRSEFLEDTLHQSINVISNLAKDSIDNNDIKLHSIHSQPTDSLLKPMMHRSDNFFAEQTLLMVSNEHLGYMSDEDIIDTLLKTDLKDVPQKPKWVDGCGLSRYNLFTPQSFVYILNKMKNEFGLKRLEVILPTGGEGSLKNSYLKDSGYIYAKTGSMSNIICLSGFLVTQKNKLLIFSILANNFQSDGAPVRRSIEQFLENVRNKF
jgi:D-alanyl-D-alanine carboxypeptidase/D-alanyl-D-alanine-endopeptidase (penicillin-binding protein 4)